MHILYKMNLQHGLNTMQTESLTPYQRISDSKDSRKWKAESQEDHENIVHILTQHGFYTYNKHAVIWRCTIFGKEQRGGREKEKNNKR